MDNTKQLPAIQGIEPPKAVASTILNGIGNGLMVAGLPFLAWEAGAKIIDKNKKFSSKFHITAGISSVVGCAVGVYFGLKEAKHMNEYRTALAKDLEALHAEIEGRKSQAVR